MEVELSIGVPTQPYRAELCMELGSLWWTSNKESPYILRGYLQFHIFIRNCNYSLGCPGVGVLNAYLLNLK